MTAVVVTTGGCGGAQEIVFKWRESLNRDRKLYAGPRTLVAF